MYILLYFYLHTYQSVAVHTLHLPPYSTPANSMKNHPVVMIPSPRQLRKKLSLSNQLLLLISFVTVAFFLVQLWAVTIVSSKTVKSRASNLEQHLPLHHAEKRNKPATLQFSPACHPHYRVATTRNITGSTSWSTSLPFTRIYFYHVRKAGGTMLRKYLKKVALTHNINLQIQENKYAIEEVGSHPGTMYVTNLRDPVERSISHFKYEGRWNCRQMIKNATHYIPTLQNAMPLEKWCETGGFVPSPCDEPFSFDQCAVNCYIQSFSGQGCSQDEWKTQYEIAQERLFRYNLIFVYERFKDPNYVKSIEQFFGVEEGSFNQASTYWCGPEAKRANQLYPLKTKFEIVMKLTKLNTMDFKFYKEAASCWDDDVAEYSFPKADADTFAPQQNSVIIGDVY